MKIFSRDFTLAEKVILVILVIVLLGLAYYKFVDQPVRQAISIADADREQAELELKVVNAKISEMQAMQSEIDDLEGSGSVSLMASYNNSQAELEMLNDVLSVTQEYTITFSNVTRSGDQIRRNFSLAFRVADYENMEQVISELSNGQYRCLVGDIRCAASKTSVTVNATATFYETMVGGTPDAGLPADSAATVQG